ncbi:MFS transporter [Novosphingobium aquae]|uniref:MFS transporter n=1 Tax=Novosphingobium aquae TaxID=3133435 RepID=A0ABU8S782_9SPHN
MATAAARSIGEPGGERGEFGHGWKVVTAALIGIGCGLSPLPFYTMGVFAPHLIAAFDWSVAEVMAGLMITTFSVVVGAPLAGALSERYGTRPVALISIVLFSLSFMSMALLQGSLVQFYITWGVIALVGSGTLPITFTRTVNRWFDKRRGIALGLAMSGTGVFGILCKPYLAWVIGDWGWRAGYVAIGAIPLVLALPIAWAWFREPAGEAAEHLTAAEKLIGVTKGEALKSWRFWTIALAMLIVSFALGGPVPNLEGILKDRGLDAATILSLTPLIGLSAIAGRIVGGLLLDRFWAPAVAFVILGLPSVACWVLSQGTYDASTAAFAILMIGFALGIEYDVLAYLTSRYFGLRAYSGLYAILYVFFALGSGIAPLVFGRIRDVTQGFGPALLTSAIALPLAAALFLLLGRYPRFEEDAA